MDDLGDISLFQWITLAVAGVMGVLTRAVIFTVIPIEFDQWRVFSVNLLGCVLLALWLGVWQNESNETLNWLIVVGFLGGFTTYSALLIQVVKISASGFSGLAQFIAVQLLIPLLLAYIVYYLISK